MAEQFADIRIGVFGGSFDPIHNGHVNAAKLFMEQMRLDYLYIIPVGGYHCVNNRIDSAPNDRLRMCELAFEGMDGVIVSDMEITRGTKSYTYDTLCALSAKNRRLLFLCGSDKVLSFDKWYKYKEILELCYPCYIRRDSDPIIDKLIVDKLSKLYAESGKMFRKIICEPIDLSSDAVKEAIKNGGDIKELVPPSVEAYIKDKGLYKE